MTDAIVIILYIVAVTITATLLYMHVQDNPTFMEGSETTATAREFNQVMGCTGASLLWPVTLIVFATIKARAAWLTPKPVKE